MGWQIERRRLRPAPVANRDDSDFPHALRWVKPNFESTHIAPAVNAENAGTELVQDTNGSVRLQLRFEVGNHDRRIVCAVTGPDTGNPTMRSVRPDKKLDYRALFRDSYNLSSAGKERYDRFAGLTSCTADSLHLRLFRVGERIVFSKYPCD